MAGSIMIMLVLSPSFTQSKFDFSDRFSLMREAVAILWLQLCLFTKNNKTIER